MYLFIVAVNKFKNNSLNPSYQFIIRIRIVASNINLLDLKKEIKAIGIGDEITLLKL